METKEDLELDIPLVTYVPLHPTAQLEHLSSLNITGDVKLLSLPCLTIPPPALTGGNCCTLKGGNYSLFNDSSSDEEKSSSSKLSVSQRQKKNLKSLGMAVSELSGLTKLDITTKLTTAK